MTEQFTVQPIATAPQTGSWILGYDPKRADQRYVPWIAITYSDKGWVDDDDEALDPILWVALPDPQPAPTGWRPPEGVIHIQEITGEGWTVNGKPVEVPYRWSVYILRRDGSYDEYRETWHYAEMAQAERRATEWQQRFGLSIEVTFLNPNVVRMLPRGTVQ